MTRKEWAKTAAGKKRLKEMKAEKRAEAKSQKEAERMRPQWEHEHERWFWSLLRIEDWDTKPVRCDSCYRMIKTSETLYYDEDGGALYRADPGVSRRHFWFLAAAEDDYSYDTDRSNNTSLRTRCTDCTFSGMGGWEPWDDDSNTIPPPKLSRPKPQKPKATAA